MGANDEHACAALVARHWGCGQRVVAVLDGLLHPGPGPYGLAGWAAAVEAAGHDVAFLHRATATLTGARPALTVEHVDQLWLAGFDDGELTPPEARVLAQFMASGGGVFATGGRGRTGRAMGGALPRVRSLRSWDGPEQAPPDTVEATDLRATPVARGAATAADPSWHPHPVVRVPGGSLVQLPGPAAGRCAAPVPSGVDLVLDGTSFEEWPERSSGGRPAALVVATAAAGEARGVLAAYDGDDVGVGRIVTAASWHHLVGAQLGVEVATHVDGVVRWLAPRSRRWCLPWSRLAWVRFEPEVVEWHRCGGELDDLVALGTTAEHLLDRRHGPGTAEEAVADLLGASGAPAALQRLFTLADPHDHQPVAPPVLVPRRLVGRAVLGGVLRELQEVLPTDPSALAGLVRRDHHELAGATTLDGVRAAEEALGTWLAGALEATDKLLSELGR